MQLRLVGSACEEDCSGRPYGVKLVCRTWEQPRSSYDAELLELIRADLIASPFQGEGHRKVWTRLGVRDGVKVGRRRVHSIARAAQEKLVSRKPGAVQWVEK